MIMEKLLTVAELADHLGVPVATIYRWNCLGTGPRVVRVGRYARYRRADVEEWEERHTTTLGFEQSEGWA
jgi:excisionase family DNA binding protein